MFVVFSTVGGQEAWRTQTQQEQEQNNNKTRKTKEPGHAEGGG